MNLKAPYNYDLNSIRRNLIVWSSKAIILSIIRLLWKPVAITITQQKCLPIAALWLIISWLPGDNKTKADYW